jgi:hypothetical protein
MSQPQKPPDRWQVWVIAHNDYLRTSTGAVRLFPSVEEAKQAAQELGGIVQVEGAPPLGGFDRALG